MDNRPDTSRSVHLSASAGSGKTRALKERYLALLDLLDRAGLGIDQAVAITFTDKAAAEIKERVMKDLPETMLRKIIRGRQDLRISTIHSFCMNLLKRYPLEAGLPPDFGVLDSRDQADRINRAVLDALEGSDRDSSLMSPLRTFTADELIGVITFLISIRSRLKRLEIDAGGPGQLIDAVRTGMAADAAEAELGALVASRDWRTCFGRMEEILRAQPDHYDRSLGDLHRQLAEPTDRASLLRIAASLAPVYFNKDGAPSKKFFIAKKSFGKGDRQGYEECYLAIQDLLVRTRDLDARVRSAGEAASLLRLYLSAEDRYHDMKLREGVLDFDDLEVHAYRLLKNIDSPEILYWLDRKILHFLVDEFQDTSDIQWAILETLTAEIFAGQGADKPMGPTLFVVGDRKQSIYRFREANYRLIDDVREKMVRNLAEGSRSIRTLDRNYRSVPEVISAVNQVFISLWGNAYIPSESDRRDHQGVVDLIEIVPDPSTDDQAGLPAEAEVLAAEIGRLIDSKMPVHEHKDGRWLTRPVAYGDCAILIQSRTRLKEYEAALRGRGVPFRVVGGIGFYEQEEIQAVINVLFFLWNREDRLSLASALKSPLFGLSDRDILGLFSREGDPLRRLAENHPFVHGRLDAWSRYAGTEPLSGLIHRVIMDSGAYVIFGRRNSQAVFNIDKLLDTAREFERRGYTTLQDFVEWIRNIREAEQREATADMNLPGYEGAVSIMTVHKAKGLEFPVLFLPGMNQKPRSVSHGPAAIIASGSGVRMAVKGSGGPVYDELWEQERDELRQEHQRLLYVAMTRARDRLVMIGTLDTGKTPVSENSWLGFLRQAIPALDAAGSRSPGLYRSSYPDWAAETLEIPETRETGAGTRTPERTIDATALIERLRPVTGPGALDWKKTTDLISADREWWSEHPAPQQPGGLSPLTRGSFLHRCLELMTTARDADPGKISHEFPEIEALEGSRRQAFLDDAAAVLGRVTGNKDMEWIFEQGPGAYSELPFLSRRENDIMSGIMDRVVVRDGIARVVDYKAISIRDQADLAAWKDHYLPQIQTYCDAAKALFRVNTVEGYLLFLDSGLLERVV
ncbi:MAG: UvrD-helicase domain-containing protein [Nitrospirota bacterium]|nr:UvrD-helicase domain-containing protein [Nitrospirota bacterium]